MSGRLRFAEALPEAGTHDHFDLVTTRGTLRLTDPRRFGDVIHVADEAAPLADGWRDRVLLHQVHPLLLHAVLFGGSYAGQVLSAARRYA